MEPMSIDDVPFTSLAIAYVKGIVAADDPAPSIQVPSAEEPVLRSVADGLLAAYLVDTGDEFAYVQHRHLTEDGIDEEILHAIGLGNLDRVAASNLEVAAHGSVFAVLLDGNFEASLILLDRLWEETFRRFVPGHYAVALPARDVLAFGDASSSQARKELQGVVRRVTGISHQLISGRLYERHGNEWRPLVG
jgi:hypothetical protein